LLISLKINDLAFVQVPDMATLSVPPIIKKNPTAFVISFWGNGSSLSAKKPV
jgi:hypothetical protein